MGIPGIKEIDLAQMAGFKAIPSAGSNRDKYIAKDFVLVLGDVKIKLSKNDTLPDVVRKINLKSHVTGIRAKAVKGQLFLESTRKVRGQSTGILLKQQPSGEGMPLNANQIIANYLKSIIPVSAPAPVPNFGPSDEDLAWLDLMHLASLNEDDPQPAVVDEVNEPDEEETNSDDSDTSIIPVEEFADANLGEEKIYQSLNALHLDMCDEFLSCLTKSDILILETILRDKLLHFNHHSIQKPSKNSSLPDRFYFCIKQIQAGKMLPFQ